ncbi:hypothetical protein Leryth_015583 [Lithospermum erythrorhizon]|nr:hypothetical protein Leryth_015583 [Lithospermum erythrorhizon]
MGMRIREEEIVMHGLIVLVVFLQLMRSNMQFLLFKKFHSTQTMRSRKIMV